MKPVKNNKHWLKQQADNNPNKIVIISDKERISYLELSILVNKSAQYFYEKGIKENDHVAIISNNSSEFIVAVNALWLIGAIPVPINIRLSVDEKLKLIQHADCKTIITIGMISGELKFKNIIHFSMRGIPITTKTFAEMKYFPANIALMMYSSGSTGNPKCVRISFENLYESFISADSIINHTANDVWLVSLPFYHIGGFSIITRAIISGCTLVLPHLVSSDVLLSYIEKHKPTLLSLVPTMLTDFINRKVSPWKELKLVLLGGGPIDEKKLKTAIDLGWPVVTVYGSTETASMITASTTKNLIENGISAGKVLSNVKINIVNEEGKPTIKNEVGEIVIKSKSVAKGYYKASEEVAGKLGKGIYYSGDLGKLDENKNIHIVGRKDDIIISGGENISLKEIENIITNLDFIIDCASLVIEDKKWGQSYILFISGKKNITEEDTRKYLNKNVSKYKLPKKIVILNSIPRNELGKLDKLKLRKIATQYSF